MPTPFKRWPAGCQTFGIVKLEIIHVGPDPKKQSRAKDAGVKAFPALVTANGNILHFSVSSSKLCRMPTGLIHL